MLTSLAPSPMARVVTLGLFYLTKETISYFYFGETLHATTASHLSAIYITFNESSGFIAMIKALPEITNAFLLLFWLFWIAFSNSFLITYSSFPSTMIYYKESFNN